MVYHAGAPGPEYGYSGLVVFLALSAFFVRRKPVSLVRRILVPWGFWLIVYGAFKAVAGNPIFLDIDPLSAVLAGTSLHLWYLPFIFLASWAIWLTRATPLAGALIAAAMLLSSPWWRDLGIMAPYAQWLQALPAIGIGLALRGRVSMAIAVAAVAICFALQVKGMSIPYLVGTAALLAAMRLPRLQLNVEPLSSCMYGVYLVHILALVVFNRITGEGQFLTAVLAFAFSCAGVWIARRFVPATRLVLG